MARSALAETSRTSTATHDASAKCVGVASTRRQSGRRSRQSAVRRLAFARSSLDSSQRLPATKSRWSQRPCSARKARTRCSPRGNFTMPSGARNWNPCNRLSETLLAGGAFIRPLPPPDGDPEREPQQSCRAPHSPSGSLRLLSRHSPTNGPTSQRTIKKHQPSARRRRDLGAATSAGDRRALGPHSSRD